jgi:hypothetical protein
MRVLQIAVMTLTLVPLFAQSAKSTGTVTPTAAEFTIPLQQPANRVWIWNRPATADNALEYSWSVTAGNGPAHYSFGFYLCKFPGSHENRGRLQDLIKAGQASAFKEDPEGRGEMLKDARVSVTVDSAAIHVRIANQDLIGLVFRNRPQTVAIHSRTPSHDYQIVRVVYSD